MAGSLNEVNLIGHVGKPPEFRSTQFGDRVANFSMAMNESWKDSSGQKQERTEWVNIVVWSDGLCGIIEQYVRKGSRLFVRGKMQTRKWTDKDGNDRWTTEVVLNRFGSQLILLDSKGGGSREDAAPADDDRRGGDAGNDFDDSIPFSPCR